MVACYCGIYSNQGKDPTSKLSYRRIALTSLMGKLFGRMLNERLLVCLDIKSCLSNVVEKRSPNLFTIKIKSILNFPSTLRQLTSLYVVDLQVGFRHPDLQTIGVHLEDLLTRLSAWTKANGFKFNTDKTPVLHFTRLPGFHIPPTFTLTANFCPTGLTQNFLDSTGTKN